MKCQFRKCKDEAVFVPRICVPHKGKPIDTHKPISIITKLHLCKEHFETFELDLEDEDNISLRGIFDMVAGQIPVELDYTRTFITRVSLTGGQYASYKRDQNNISLM